MTKNMQPYDVQSRKTVAVRCCPDMKCVKIAAVMTAAVVTAVMLLSGCKDEKTKISEEILTLQQVSPVPAAELSEYSGNRSEISQKLNISASDYKPINYDVQKAIWLSYIDLADMIKGKTKQQFTDEIEQAFDNIRNFGLNTVYVHIRPFGDALYDSEIFPQSKYYTGNFGRGAGWDALEIMVDQAHRKGLSVHAWINPLRCESSENIAKLSGEYLIKKWYDSGDYFGKYILPAEGSDKLWLNPAYEEVRELVCDGVREICENYKVDGIHIDDYFYPTADESFDSYAFEKSGQTSLSDFRLENTNLLIAQLYQTVKTANPRLVFGISPQGNIQNNYEKLFADVKSWAGQSGWCDYIVPQVYYGFENEAQPFEQVIESWNELADGETKLVIGLAFYKVGNDEEFAENSGVIANQIEAVKALENYGGVALYSYKSIFGTDGKTSGFIKTEAEKAEKALEDQTDNT